MTYAVTIVVVILVLRYLVTRRVRVSGGKNGRLRLRRGRTRKGIQEDKQWRQERKGHRRGTRYRRSRLIGGRGYLGVRMCSCGCGRTAGHCKEMTARAEHPEGMLGPRKK